MDKKIIFLLFLHLSIFPHPYDERLADIMIKAKEAYLKKNLTVLISASYDLLYLEEIKDLKKVLKLAEEVTIIKKSEAGALHISQIYKKLGMESDYFKWKIIYDKILNSKGKRWKKD